MASKRLDDAFQRMSIARQVCHTDKPLHLKVHRALIRLGWLITHISLFSLAWLFD